MTEQPEQYNGIPWVVMDYVGRPMATKWHDKLWVLCKWAYINMFWQGAGAKLRRTKDGWYYDIVYHIFFAEEEGIHFKWTKEDGKTLMQDFEENLAAKQIPMDPEESRLIFDNVEKLV